MVQESIKHGQLSSMLFSLHSSRFFLLHVSEGLVPVIVRVPDAHQLGQSIKEGYISCSYLTTAYKVVKCATDIYNHIRGRELLSAISWQYRH